MPTQALGVGVATTCAQTVIVQTPETKKSTFTVVPTQRFLLLNLKLLSYDKLSVYII